MNNLILGIHCEHDATAALSDNKGNVIAAVAEERITRVKFHAGFPYQAIDEVFLQNYFVVNQANNLVGFVKIYVVFDIIISLVKKLLITK